ncbi:MAG: SurA N-terminal domain-containing protein [Pedobacter sp.]|nr:SurA N-terminal domain-containing protein [Pedobacter sp.]
MEAFRDMVKGWLGKTLLVILVVPFAIVGLESYFAGGGKVVAAKVNGKEILEPEVEQLVERQRQQLIAQMGPNADASKLDVQRLRKDVLNGLISKELLAQQAKQDGYLVSDATVYKLIREVPAFQDNGKFSQARYEQMLMQIGESPASYPAKAKQELAYSMLIAGLSQSGFTTSTEMARLSALDNQKRDIHLATVPAARYLGEIKVGDDEIKKFYDSNAPLFTTQETATLEYFTLKREDFIAAAQPTEDDLKALYEEKVKSLASNEQRQAQHILITVDTKTKDADALKKIQDIEKRARAGEDFAKLAKEFSQDPGSVANGGDLGLANRGQFVPEFDKSLFSLKEGEISEPVKTQYGYHLIKLNKVQTEQASSFAALRPELEKEAKAAKAEELFADQIDKLDAAVYEASDLKEPAEKFKLALNTSEALTRKGAAAGLLADRKVLDTAFSDDLLHEGKNSQGLHMADGSVVWLHVKEHAPAKLLPLAQIAPDVRNQLLLDKAREKAKSVAEAASKALNEGKSLAEVAAANNLSWQDFLEAGRRTQLQLPELLQTAYRLPRPAAGKASADILAVGPSYAVVAVSRVVDGASTLGPEVDQMRNVLGENRSQQEFTDYVRSLRESHKVKVYERKKESTEE